ncbi:MAG: phage holin [Oscillospiraceae bacterium]|nr:phage holin [Oscillospiraceae bacterium]MBQ3560915.1 phage holin [Oscillospiraceae bacterium]
MNNIDITPIIEAIILLIATVISVVLVPWIKSKTTTAQRQELVEWAKIAVQAAEQIYLGVGRGEEKKAHVIEFLNSKGLTFDEESINNAIEAAVKQLKTEGIIH